MNIPEIRTATKALVQTTKRLRALQKEYFQFKDPRVLRECKNVEARLDREIVELEELIGKKIEDL